jgi:hypothetical protein
VDQLAQLIQREGEPASYECLRVTADYLHRTILLHRGRFPAIHPEEFACIPQPPEELEPLNLLFRGPWVLGHFLAVISLGPRFEENAPKSRQVLRANKVMQSPSKHQ